MSGSFLMDRCRRSRGQRRAKRLWAFLGVAFFFTCLLFLCNVASISSRIDPISKQGEPHLQAGICNRSLYPNAWELRSDQLTILVNGFSEARLPLLQKSMYKYSSSPQIHSILILWGNVSTPSSTLQEASFITAGAPIFILRQETVSLNDRFLPRPFIKTRSVMVCDDDITIELEDLRFALDIWSQNQNKIVGFFPRSHSYHLHTKSWIYSKNPVHYSIMLTKLMIIATEFLYLYTCEMPAGVREYVDEGMNCEDIAMNFLVSSYGGVAPLLVAGKPQDWGDPRAADSDFNAGGLSARAGHRKDRGDCIGVFQKLWGGMELRYSSMKASSGVEEQAVCEKFGHLIHCDDLAFSRRAALRISGKHIHKSTKAFAYVTIVESPLLLNASFVLAQSLRSTGTLHDLVALLHPSATITLKHPLLQHHFDVVRKIPGHSSNLPGFHHLLFLWLLSEYTTVVYVDVEALILCNLDHLFELSDFAAASQTLHPQYFDPGFLVLKPSNATYWAMMDLLASLTISPLLMTADTFLNAFFNDWFEMPVSSRLPVYYNWINHPAAESESPPGFDRSAFAEKLGSLAVVRFSNLTLALAAADMKEQPCTYTCCNIWIQIFQALARNSFYPYENESLPIPPWLCPANLTSPLYSIPRPPRKSSLEQAQPHLEAFATLMYKNNSSCLEGWVKTFQEHHFLGRSIKTLLIVVSSVKEQLWKPYASHFSDVSVVHPVTVNGKAVHPSFALLYLWNQTRFSKLIYVDHCSIFLKDCNVLLDYDPFAAVPNLLLPDTFSTDVMVVQPDRHTHDSLLHNLQTYKDLDRSFENYANFYYRDWRAWPARHRIPPPFRIDMRFRVEYIEHSTKLLTFSDDPPIWSSSTNWTLSEEQRVMNLRQMQRLANRIDPVNATKM